MEGSRKFWGTDSRQFMHEGWEQEVNSQVGISSLCTKPKKEAEFVFVDDRVIISKIITHCAIS